MFIKVSNINYCINTDNKTATEIYYELFSRMNVHSISSDQKLQIIESIREQMTEQMTINNIYRPI